MDAPDRNTEPLRNVLGSKGATNSALREWIKKAFRRRRHHGPRDEHR